MNQNQICCWKCGTYSTDVKKLCAANNEGCIYKAFFASDPFPFSLPVADEAANELKSHPYLALARKFGVDYGAVLAYSDLAENHRDDNQWVSFKARYGIGQLDATLPLDCRLEILKLNEDHVRRWSMS